MLHARIEMVGTCVSSHFLWVVSPVRHVSYQKCVEPKSDTPVNRSVGRTKTRQSRSLGMRLQIFALQIDCICCFQCFVRGVSPFGKVFSLKTPSPLGNYCPWTPPPPRNFTLSSVGGGTDIFWNHTMSLWSKPFTCKLLDNLHWPLTLYLLEEMFSSESDIF